MGNTVPRTEVRMNLKTCPCFVSRTIKNNEKQLLFNHQGILVVSITIFK